MWGSEGEEEGIEGDRSSNFYYLAPLRINTSSRGFILILATSYQVTVELESKTPTLEVGRK